LRRDFARILETFDKRGIGFVPIPGGSTLPPNHQGLAMIRGHAVRNSSGLSLTHRTTGPSTVLLFRFIDLFVNNVR